MYYDRRRITASVMKIVKVLIVKTPRRINKNGRLALYFSLSKEQHQEKMPGLREAREALLMAHFGNFINDEEFLLLYDINKSKNSDFPYWNYDTFDLDDLNEDE